MISFIAACACVVGLLFVAYMLLKVSLEASKSALSE